ncbi:MAG: proton-conducting membrane transporter [Clostridia bacterium]|nr:proton-conducting membrane transporter [Clostridia bacterium]MCI2000043.1 proton-conducting membrane transporter [Clostridia bacterium]MCI2014423.1 proton-conducting membrane transporter [Clostridia bacterium]
MNSKILLFPIFFPMFAAITMPFLRKSNIRNIVISVILAVETAVVLFITYNRGFEITIWQISNILSISFKNDGLSRFFSCFIAVIWLLVGIYSFEYMKHERNVERYFLFYLISLGVLLGISYSSNFMTMYLFYEFMTLMTVPLVLHNETHEAINAGLKYMGYSVFGAGLGLIGFFFLCHYAPTTSFIPGGVLTMDAINRHGNILRVVYLGMMIGFGCKAGMYPLHAWLPTAHPVAPAPASAVLSGIITKCGVYAVIRTTYYLYGVEFLEGTWVQNVLLILTICTIFMGSMLAYREKLLKKRLAYSTISQVSYILFGVFLMTPVGMCGALLHIIGHAIAKNCLFLSAGSIIYRTGKTYVDELSGIGKQMPIVMGCFTVASLSLIGIPPTAGFISKWYLAAGALDCRFGGSLPTIGVVVLIISALLTAGYLLDIVAEAYFPGKNFDYSKLEKKEPNGLMFVPLLILAAGVVLVGSFPSSLVSFFNSITNGLF